MKYKMIIRQSILLLVMIANSLGHAIFKVNTGKSEELSSGSQDLYGINEGPKTVVTFVNPKSAKPTLREITYFHVIEKPYSDGNDSSQSTESEDPVLDEEHKIFTNSHSGYQFLNADQNKDNVEGPVEESAKKVEADKNVPNKVTETALKEDNEKINNDNHIPDIDIRIPEKNEDIKIVDKETIPKMDTVTEVSVQKENSEINIAPRSRKLLFDRVREKYSKKNVVKDNSPGTGERRKRNTRQHIPEAPRLPDIDWNILPAHLQTLLSPIVPSNPPNQDLRVTNNKKVNKLKSKMDSMIRKLSDSDANAEKPVLKTYGMDISGNSGIVWNDFLNIPGSNYNIDISKPHDAQKPQPTILSNEDNAEEDSEMVPKTDFTKTSTNNEENPVEAALKSYGMNLKNGNGYVWNELNGYPGPRYIEVGNSEDNNDKRINLTRLKEEEVEDIVVDDIKDVSSGEQKAKNNVVDNENVMDKLIENEFFWEWLTTWTSAFMESMTESIQTQIKNEVKNQIEEYIRQNEVNESKDTNDNKPFEEKSKQVQNKSASTKDLRKDELSKDNPETSKAIEREIINKENATGDNVSRNEDSEHKTTNSINESNNLRENNFELPGDVRIDSEDINNKTSDASISARTLIGNSVGNNKVTNIYIFYPNKEMSDIINEMRLKNVSEIELNSFKEPSATIESSGVDTAANESSKVDTGSNKEVEAATLVSLKNENSDGHVDNVIPTITTSNNNKEDPSKPTTQKEEIASTTSPTGKLENVSVTQSIVESTTEKSLHGNVSIKVVEGENLGDSESNKSGLIERKENKTEETKDKQDVNANKPTDNAVKENKEQTEEKRVDSKNDGSVKVSENSSDSKVETTNAMKEENLQ